MAGKYLGGVIVTDFTGTPFEGYTQKDWCMYFITVYGQLDGSHIKATVIDDIARILTSCPIEVSYHTWETGESEYRVTVNQLSDEYIEWVKSMIFVDGEEYSYDAGNNDISSISEGRTK